MIRTARDLVDVNEASLAFAYKAKVSDDGGSYKLRDSGREDDHY